MKELWIAIAIVSGLYMCMNFYTGNIKHYKPSLAERVAKLEGKIEILLEERISK